MPDVVHKVTYRLDPHALEQVVEVPTDAVPLAVDWDTRNTREVALWFRTGQPDGSDRWTLFVRGTGHDVPPGAQYLGTVIAQGFAWHLFRAAPL